MKKKSPVKKASKKAVTKKKAAKKAAPKKAAVKNDGYVSVSTPAQFLKFPAGSLFKAKIKGKPVEGRIQIEDGYCYLCQNEHEGSAPRDPLGYIGGWVLPLHSPFSYHDVTNLKIKKVRNFISPNILVKLTDRYTAIIVPEKFVKVGCQVIDGKKIKEIAKYFTK